MSHYLPNLRIKEKPKPKKVVSKDEPKKKEVPEPEKEPEKKTKQPTKSGTGSAAGLDTPEKRKESLIYINIYSSFSKNPSQI